MQCSFSQSLVRLIGELKVDEEMLHSGLPEHLQGVLKGKRLCLFHNNLSSSLSPDGFIALTVRAEKEAYSSSSMCPHVKLEVSSLEGNFG